MYKEKKLKTSAVAALLEAITKYFSFVIMKKKNVCLCVCLFAAVWQGYFNVTDI